MMIGGIPGYTSKFTKHKQFKHKVVQTRIICGVDFERLFSEAVGKAVA